MKQPDRPSVEVKTDMLDRFILRSLETLARVALFLPWFVWHLLSNLVGTVGMAFGWRRVVLTNVRHVLHNDPPSRLLAWYPGMQQIANYCKTVITLLRSSARSEISPDSLVVKGFEKIEPYLGRRGVVLVAPHAGPYPALGLIAMPWLKERGFDGPLTVAVRLAKPFGSNALTLWMDRHLTRAGMVVVTSDEAPGQVARTLLASLRSKGILILLVDEPTDAPSRLVPFFDSHIRLPIGPARLAHSTGSVILPCMVTHGRSGTCSLTIDEPIEPSNEHAETLKAVASSLEKLISRHPDQWTMLTPIWHET